MLSYIGQRLQSKKLHFSDSFAARIKNIKIWQLDAPPEFGLGGRAHFLAETCAHSRRQRGEGLEPVSDARLSQMLRQSYVELEVASVALLPTVVMVMCSWTQLLQWQPSDSCSSNPLHLLCTNSLHEIPYCEKTEHVKCWWRNNLEHLEPLTHLLVVV